METVYSAPKGEQERLISRFLEVIRQNGDYVQIKKIFRAVQKAMIEKNGAKIITLEFAREVSRELLQKLKNNFSKKDHIEVVFSPDLVAGVRVSIDDTWELDATMRRKLKKLF